MVTVPRDLCRILSFQKLCRRLYEPPESIALLGSWIDLGEFRASHVTHRGNALLRFSETVVPTYGHKYVVRLNDGTSTL
ncbi:hypothetical protein J6590_034606 [Homalodisca vitripennis]|nr:hypothetical protein J6590_034606 [Homalodisca vitripennis]